MTVNALGHLEVERAQRLHQTRTIMEAQDLDALVLVKAVSRNLARPHWPCADPSL